MTNDYAVHSDMEGFLDDTSFNGVIFLLREPNTGKENTQTEFWFKKRLQGDYAYNDAAMGEAQIRNDKRACTKYRNRFEELLTYVFPCSDEELRDEKLFRFAYYKKLCHAAYFNLRPDAGNSSIAESETYSELLNNPDYVTMRFKSIVGYCQKRPAGELTVFTCSDIFDKLAEYYPIKQSIKDDGVDYGKNGKKQSFKWNKPNPFGITITVYEIMHPSRSPKLKFEK